MSTTRSKLVRLAAAWALLGAIVACTPSDEDDTPPPPPVTAPAMPAQPSMPSQPALPQPGQQQPAPMAPMQTISLSTGFLPDPQTARTTAGGPQRAAIWDSNCRGWVPSTPQFTLTLQTAFRNLRIIAHSAQDTTLTVRGPGGIRCEDDSESTHPIIEGSFEPGTYEVFVGLYSASGTAPVVVAFTELSSTTAAELGF
jgi:hypothetical protein